MSYCSPSPCNHHHLQPPLHNTGLYTARSIRSFLSFNSSGPELRATTKLGPQTHPQQSQIWGVLKKLEVSVHVMDMGACMLAVADVR